MNRYTPVILLALCLSIATPAQAQSSGIPKEFRPFLTRGETTWGISGGVRTNKLDWNIASDLSGNATPNILSELTWDSITVMEVQGNVQHDEPMDIGVIDGDLHLETKAHVGFTISGDNQDSDYLGDNRTLEFSRSNNDAGEGFSVGGQVAAGYKIYLTGDRTRRANRILASRPPRTAYERRMHSRALRKAINNATPIVSLTPLIGYGWDQQQYKMLGGTQTVNTIGPGLPDVGATLPDLNIEYDAEWYGPFIGLEGEVKGQKNKIRLRGQYHDLSYFGKGYWRGRPTFRQNPSYTHDAEGSGILLEAEYAYALGKDYALTLDAMYQRRKAEDGIYTTYFVDNSSSKIKFNEANDESMGLHLGFQYNW